MYLQHIINIMKSRNLSGAQLARRCGVSRAAVSKWFAAKESFINVETHTARRVAQVLGIPIAHLFEPVEDLSQYQTAFLWDGLFRSMEQLIMAVMRGNPAAMARFVQVAGFFRAEAVFGKKIITEFPRYKQFIKPVRRKSLETIWPLLASTH